MSEKKNPEDRSTGRLTLRLPPVILTALEAYLDEVNRNAMGAVTSRSSLVTALLQRHLIENGALSRRDNI